MRWRRSTTRRCTRPTPWRSTWPALAPRPGKVVANLPYGVAATVLLKALEELPEASLLVAMVQREVAERLAAGPEKGKLYGATSVLAQLSCDVEVLRRVPRDGVPPRAGRRVGARAAAPAGAGAVARRSRAGARGLRPPAQGAGRLAGARARAPRPASATGPARRWSSWATRPTPAPSAWRPPTSPASPSCSAADVLAETSAREGQPRAARRPPARRRPARAVLAVRPARARRRADLRAGRRRDEVVAPGVDGPNLVQHALAAFRTRAALVPLRVTIEKRIPVAGGLGGGSADAAATLRAANRMAGEPLSPDELRRAGRAHRRRRAEPGRPGAGAGDRGGGDGRALRPARAVAGAGPERGGPVHGGGVRGARPPARRARRSTPPRWSASRTRRRPRSPRRWRTTWRPAALSLRPELQAPLDRLAGAGALAARLSGSGPTAFGLFGDEEAAAAAAEAIPGALVTHTRPSPASQ